LKKFIFIVALPLALTSCDGNDGKSSTQLQEKLITSSLKNMVKIKGGVFKMGDFGNFIGDKRPISLGEDDKFVHDVKLNDFSISKYKVTWKEFDVFAKEHNINKPELPYSYRNDAKKLQAPNMPAALTWQQAKDYCTWLGVISGKNIDLPSEAQWEYAARNGGKYIVYATDNGKYEEGRNVASTQQRNDMTHIMFNYPVGKFPPTPLGLYDMAGNGVDWMQDWYSSNYYENSPKENPTGPISGTEKVIRGYDSGGDEYSNQTVVRQSEDPNLGKRKWILPYYNARCVINN
jgi:formylglycine-generating enzyme